MILTPLGFIRRFTPEQRIAIRAAQDPVIEDGLMLLTLAEEVDPADRDTIYFVQHCVTLGLITQFDADLILRTE